VGWWQLLRPASGADTNATPSLVFRTPAGFAAEVYLTAVAAEVYLTADGRFARGVPTGKTFRHCSVAGTAAGTYHCDVRKSDGLVPGGTSFWWVWVRGGGGEWLFGPQTFTVRSTTPRDEHYAPYLPSSAHFSGKSVKQTRLSQAAYALSKVIGAPKAVAVPCWSTLDWRAIAGDNPERGYNILGFWEPGMPHWLQLCPGICNALETLTYKRPRFANRFTANAVDTLTHEMIHALGVRSEAATKCFSMQLLWLTARSLGVPPAYAENLSKLSLENYGFHPPQHVDRSACRENGALDLFKNRPSLPWNTFRV
jgi:hypothetical protein